MASMELEVPKRRIVVTGSRDWTDVRRVFGQLRREQRDADFLLGVGDCPTGADEMALAWGRKHLYWPVTQYTAPWETRHKAAGQVRNHFMIDMFQPHLVLAFFMPGSRGTKDCAEYAEGKGIEVRKFYEDLGFGVAAGEVDLPRQAQPGEEHAG